MNNAEITKILNWGIIELADGTTYDVEGDTVQCPDGRSTPARGAFPEDSELAMIRSIHQTEIDYARLGRCVEQEWLGATYYLLEHMMSYCIGRRCTGPVDPSRSPTDFFVVPAYWGRAVLDELKKLEDTPTRGTEQIRDLIRKHAVRIGVAAGPVDHGEG